MKVLGIGVGIDLVDQCSGLDLTRPAFISWLGVTMYLTRAAISQVITELSQLAPAPSSSRTTC
jgi:O-methyltransferase involved in polyketide biosynthesis